MTAIPPLVSVIIPTFNRAHLLPATIDSVLAQTWQPLEVLVVDDGSTDETTAIVAAYGTRVRYLRQVNAGVSSARNHGARAAQGAYLAFLDDDDLFEPTKIDRQMACFQAQPSVGLVHCRYFLADHAGTVIGQMGLLPAGTILGELLVRNFLWMSAPLIPRAVFEAVGGFTESLSTAADYDLWLRIARRYAFGCVQSALGTYRLHAGSMVTNVNRTEDEILRILNTYFEDPTRDTSYDIYKNEAYVVWRLWFASRHYAVGNWERAAENVEAVLALRPGLPADVFLNRFYYEAVDERVSDPFAYVESVFAHLPRGLEFIRPFHHQLVGHVHLGLALKAVHARDHAVARQHWEQAATCYADRASLATDFRETAFHMVMGVGGNSDVLVADIFASLPVIVQHLAALEANLRGDLSIAQAFEAYHAQDPSRVIPLVWQSLQTRPALLGNRGVVSIAVKSLAPWLKAKLTSTPTDDQRQD